MFSWTAYPLQGHCFTPSSGSCTARVIQRASTTSSCLSMSCATAPSSSVWPTSTVLALRMQWREVGATTSGGRKRIAGALSCCSDCALSPPPGGDGTSSTGKARRLAYAKREGRAEILYGQVLWAKDPRPRLGRARTGPCKIATLATSETSASLRCYEHLLRSGASASAGTEMTASENPITMVGTWRTSNTPIASATSTPKSSTHSRRSSRTLRPAGAAAPSSPSKRWHSSRLVRSSTVSSAPDRGQSGNVGRRG